CSSVHLRDALPFLPVDSFSGASKVNIDRAGASAHSTLGVNRHKVRRATKQLNLDGHSVSRQAILANLGGQAQKYFRRQHLIVDSYELSDTAINTTQARQKVAHMMIYNSLHWSQNNSHKEVVSLRNVVKSRHLTSFATDTAGNPAALGQGFYYSR